MEKQPYDDYTWSEMIPNLKKRNTNPRAWSEEHGFKYKTVYGLATGMRPPCDLGPASMPIVEKALEEGLIRKRGQNLRA